MKTSLVGEDGTVYNKISYAYENMYDRFCKILDGAYFFGTLNTVTRITYLFTLFSFLCLIAALILSVVAAFSGKAYLPASVLFALGGFYALGLNLAGIIFSPLSVLFLFSAIVYIWTFILLLRAFLRHRKEKTAAKLVPKS